jgi:hypothetical protein
VVVVVLLLPLPLLRARSLHVTSHIQIVFARGRLGRGAVDVCVLDCSSVPPCSRAVLHATLQFPRCAAGIRFDQRKVHDFVLEDPYQGI